MISDTRRVERLREAIAVLGPGDERPPGEVPAFWDEILRISLNGWVDALARDLDRIGKALDRARSAQGRDPTDDEVAALEECLWRIATATEKVDAIVSLIFGGQPFVVIADQPGAMAMRPSHTRNAAALKTLGSEVGLRLVAARAAVSGERTRLRRHQLMHSLAPIDALSDLGVFIRAHHRDGRIFGYELLRWSPERGLEGIRELRPEALFGQRLKEVSRGVDALDQLVDALTAAILDAPVASLPQIVYYDHDSGRHATERPSPTGPPASYEVDFVLEQSDPQVSRRVSCTSLMVPGVEILFDDGLWRVIRTDKSATGADQTALCRLMEGD